MAASRPGTDQATDRSGDGPRAREASLRTPIGDRDGRRWLPIIVTEIRTPTKAPNLAEASASMPAIPRRKTTIRESASSFR